MFDDGASDARVGGAIGITARHALTPRYFLSGRFDWSCRGGASIDALRLARFSVTLMVRRVIAPVSTSKIPNVPLATTPSQTGQYVIAMWRLSGSHTCEPMPCVLPVKFVACRAPVFVPAPRHAGWATGVNARAGRPTSSSLAPCGATAQRLEDVVGPQPASVRGPFPSAADAG